MKKVLWQKGMNYLNFPVLVTKRPVWDTFPGAWYTIAIDVIMPDGRTLQVASVHHTEISGPRHLT